MFLVRDLVRVLDDDISVGESFIGVTMADLEVGIPIGAVLRMDENRVVKRCINVRYKSQLFPLGQNGNGTSVGGIERLGDDHCQMVCFPPTDIGGNGNTVVVSRANEHRLVKLGQAVFVAGHVGGGDNRDHTGYCLGRTYVQTYQPSVRLAGEDDLGDKCIVKLTVAGVDSGAVSLRQRVETNGR